MNTRADLASLVVRTNRTFEFTDTLLREWEQLRAADRDHAAELFEQLTARTRTALAMRLAGRQLTRTGVQRRRLRSVS